MGKPKGSKGAAPPQKATGKGAQKPKEDKKVRLNYGRTGAVERVLIVVAGPKLKDYQGTMTGANERFGNILEAFTSELPLEKACLAVPSLTAWLLCPR